MQERIDKDRQDLLKDVEDKELEKLDNRLGTATIILTVGGMIITGILGACKAYIEPEVERRKIESEVQKRIQSSKES